jgi:hypothetical protein
VGKVGHRVERKEVGNQVEHKVVGYKVEEEFALEVQMLLEE